MKRLLPASLLIVTVASMTACYGPTPPPNRPRGRSLDVPPRYGMAPETQYIESTNLADPNAAAKVQVPDPNAPVTGDAVTPPPTTGSTTAPPPVVVTPPGVTPAPAPVPAELPFATRITGKPGFVKSPFDPGGQAIDVRDFQSGQKARCPYTGKVFRVP